MIDLPIETELILCNNMYRSETDGIEKIQHRLVPCTTSICIIPYRTVPPYKIHIPYRTATAEGSRYTVWRNTVPSNRFCYFSKSTIIRFISHTNKFFKSY